jgi:glycosyltransferase involved in cell wall biosynthesis
VSAAVAFVLKGYPRLSETFIAQEIRALEERGIDIRLISLRRPTDRHIHPVHREIRAPVNYLPEYLYRAPLRVWRGWRAGRRLSGYATALSTWLRDLGRDPTPNRVRRFGQALVLARELPGDVRWIHAHFLHTPASVARYAALMLGLPWSCSAHAKDVWTTPAWEKAEKLADCRWLVTCTQTNHDHLAQLAPARRHVDLVYHGLDGGRFPPPGHCRPPRNGNDATDPVILLSVGRTVVKKGYDDLLDALGRLPATLHWRLVHIGGGPLLRKLKRRAQRDGLSGRISWMGSQPQDAVLAQYRAADAFVLACRIADDGDRDGLPNVLMEAQSQGLACLSTAVSAIPELIVTGETGLLVAPGDRAALAESLARLIADAGLRKRLGAAGMERLCTSFSFEDGINRLAQRFGPQVLNGQ